MKKRFEDKTVLIIGATGGLGESYAKAFLKEGAAVLLAGRDEQKVQDLVHRLAGDITVAQVDITDAESVQRLAAFAQGWSEKIDIVVNATGYDVRKSLEDHQFDEIHKSLDTNLLGAILVTKVFLPHLREQKGSTIVHMGGFADGHMAFPYYGVDVATRAGIFSFVESMNRELYQQGSKVFLTYYCPNAADTKAEQPFHEIWKEMGISISSTEQVASELLNAIVREKKVYMMGGIPVRFFAKLNTLFPKLADMLLLKKYGSILKKHLGNSNAPIATETETSKKGFLKKLAIGLVVFSFVLYALLPAIPFLPFDLPIKAVITGSMLVVSEIVFWIGGLLLGKEIIAKFRNVLNPLKWCKCK